MHHEIFTGNKALIRLYQSNTSMIKRTADATMLGQYKEVDAKDKYVVQLIKNGEANGSTNETIGNYGIHSTLSTHPGIHGRSEGSSYEEN